jgi:hypothetical protein
MIGFGAAGWGVTVREANYSRPETLGAARWSA